MNALPTQCNLTELQEGIAENLIYLDKECLVFIDTNILTWIYRLNNDSFNEFKNLLSDLVSKEKLIIPNWVVQEYNNLLLSNSEEIFFPFKRRLKSLNNDLDYLEELSKLVVDNELAKKNDFINKREFMKELSNEVESLKKKVKLVTNKNNFSFISRREFIEELIKKSQSLLNIDEITKLDSEFQFRLDSNIPPYGASMLALVYGSRLSANGVLDLECQQFSTANNA